VTPGNVEFVQVVTSMAVCTGGVAAVLKLDERLRERAWSEHAWRPITVDAAVFGTFLFSWLYGAPALIIHFVKSRWSLLGFGLGLAWAVALVAADLAAQVGVAAAIEGLGL
jgi:hypothetical protein